MTRLLLLFIAVVAAVVFVHWLMNEDPKLVAAKLRRGALWAGAGVLVLLAVTGRLHWLFAVLGAAAPFVARLLSLLRFAPLFSQLYSHYQNTQSAKAAGLGNNPGGPDTSYVRSKFLHMTLDHDSGEMDGEILQGDFQGQRLSQLPVGDLLALLDDYRTEDQDSAALLQAYLDRYHAGWEQQGSQERQDADPGGGPMSREEAGQILGIDPDATKEEIIAAHRRLMQKLHPDRGGSDYLAAKINQAKDLLL
ncbi:MAG: DnaJ domain-containing protein [Gammaproteobacteria bacterium]|nr:DnaJ domain-containing protein [Gammaproteobacteria bacterium]